MKAFPKTKDDYAWRYKSALICIDHEGYSSKKFVEKSQDEIDSIVESILKMNLIIRKSMIVDSKKYHFLYVSHSEGYYIICTVRDVNQDAIGAYILSGWKNGYAVRKTMREINTHDCVLKDRGDRILILGSEMELEIPCEETTGKYCARVSFKNIQSSSCYSSCREFIQTKIQTGEQVWKRSLFSVTEYSVTCTLPELIYGVAILLLKHEFGSTRLNHVSIWKHGKSSHPTIRL
jgi:hypothetical protein